MNYVNEIEVLKVLGIESFRNITKDKVMMLASMLPEMDKELAGKIIEQVPQLKELAIAMFELMRQEHESTLDHNEASNKRVHDAWDDVRRILAGELDKELTPEQWQYAVDTIAESARQQSAKDSENKGFLDTQLGKVTTAASVATLVLGVIAIGGRAYFQNGGGRPAL